VTIYKRFVAVDSTSYVAKLGPTTDVTGEATRYRRIVGRLDAGSFAPLAFEICDGAAGLGGNFYTIANRDAVSLFGWVRAQPEDSPKVVSRIEANTKHWLDARTSRSTTLGAVRRLFGEELDLAGIVTPIVLERFVELEPIARRGSSMPRMGATHHATEQLRGSRVTVTLFGSSAMKTPIVTSRSPWR
jgi:hypothetical protein